MKLTLNDSLFDEAFQIISTNESKANSLRQSLLKNNNFDNNDELNMKIIQCLGEFEYDLKTLYRIVRDLKLSYNDIHNTLINSKKEEYDNKFKFDDINKYKKEKIYSDDFENKLKEGNKTYYMTSSQVNRNNNNRCKNIKEFYIRSYHIPENARKFQRSMSCKSYIGNWKTNNDKNNFNSINNENKFQNEILSYNSRDYTNDKFFDSNFSDKDNELKLNFDYDSYLTDYSLNKTTKKDPNSPNNKIGNSIIPKESLNLSDLKNENNYDVPSKYINNKIDIDNNNNKQYLNQNQNNNNEQNEINNNNNSNNNIFTFSDPKANQNSDKDFIATFDPKYINKNNMINKDINNEYLDNQNNNDKNSKYTYEDFINDKYNKNDNKNNKFQLNENKEINNKNINEEENNNNINNNNEELNNNKNNNLNYNFDDNDDNKIVNNNEEDNLEDKKKEKIKYIVSEIFQDPNKLDLLKRKLGDDIGEKLLSGNIDEEELLKVIEILKKNQDYINNKNINIKKPKRYFPKKRFNQPSDKVLLKEQLKEKRYNYREFPRGWSSTKDFFVNNGSTFLRDRSKKKYYN